jgi:2-succinyl-6-hydroxy-2,4-cyclohexadiene-1-carboxylate synthase
MRLDRSSGFDPGPYRALSWFRSAMAADLVLLHGFTQTGRSWRPVRHALAARYRAVAPDLPGHGDFAGRRPASFAATDAYVRVLGGDRFTLVGYSMGGRIALHAALALGDRVERLILVGASPGLADPAERSRRAAEDAGLADRIEAIGLEAFVREWAAQPLFAGMPRGVAEAATADRMRNTAAGLAAALRGLGTGVMPSLWERLGELKQPVELVVGERDEKFRAIAERMAAGLPQARVHVVAGMGHAVQVEAPEAVAELVLALPRR